MIIVKCIHHRHRTGQSELHFVFRFGAQKFCVVYIYRLFARDCINDDRHLGVVTVADAHGFLSLKIHAVKILDECRHKMSARLFAVADDVNAGVLLIAQCQPHRVALAFGQGIALKFPRRP